MEPRLARGLDGRREPMPCPKLPADNEHPPPPNKHHAAPMLKLAFEPKDPPKTRGRGKPQKISTPAHFPMAAHRAHSVASHSTRAPALKPPPRSQVTAHCLGEPCSLRSCTGTWDIWRKHLAAPQPVWQDTLLSLTFSLQRLCPRREREREICGTSVLREGGREVPHTV